LLLKSYIEVSNESVPFVWGIIYDPQTQNGSSPWPAGPGETLATQHMAPSLQSLARQSYFFIYYYCISLQSYQMENNL